MVPSHSYKMTQHLHRTCACVPCVLDDVISNTSRQTYRNNHKRPNSDVFFLECFLFRVSQIYVWGRGPWASELSGSSMVGGGVGGVGGGRKRRKAEQGDGDRREKGSGRVRRECLVQSSCPRTSIWAKSPRCPCCQCPSCLLGSSTE